MPIKNKSQLFGSGFGQLAEHVDATGRYKLGGISVPEKKPPLLLGVDEGEVVDFIKKYEGVKTHLYKDHKGYLTIGVGHRVLTRSDARDLPFYVHDVNEVPVRRADQRDIDMMFNNVRALPFGGNIGADLFKHHNKSHVRLKSEDVDTLLRRDLRIKAEELRKNWLYFDQYNSHLKKVMMDIHFNTGNLTPKKWPKLAKAIYDRDKLGVIRETQRKTKHQERNDAVKTILTEMDVVR